MNKKILKTGLIVILLLALTTVVAHANQINPDLRPINSPFSNQFGGTPEQATLRILQLIAGALLYFAAPIAVIMIIIAAFNMQGGGADSEKLEQSKKALSWTLIGLIVIILSYSIVRGIIALLLQAAS